MKIKILFPIMAVVALVAACKEDEIIYFDLENDTAIRFPGVAGPETALYPGYNAAKDAYMLDFSFQSMPVGTEFAEVDLPVRIVGNTVDYDRTVALEIVAEETNATQYEILEAIVPANEAFGRIRFRVEMKESLNNVRDTVTVALLASDDFRRGPDDYIKGVFTYSNIIPAIPSASFNYQSYNLLILSEQTRTANNLTAYSPNAHRAILDAMGWPVGFWVRYNQGFDPFNNVNVLDAIYMTDLYVRMLEKYLDDYAAANNGERLKHNAGSQVGKDVVARVPGAVYVP